MATRRPKGTGQKKIEIQPIESKAARAVCFSKRRKGLFNKVSELSTLCGAEVAAVTFSPWGKAFTFGRPSVDSVLDRFCPSNSSEAQAVEAVDRGDGDRNLARVELNRKVREFSELRAQLAAIKAQKKAKEYFAKARADGNQAAAWLEPGIDVSQMAEEDLAAFAAALEKVRAAVRANQVLQEGLLFGRPVHGGVGQIELGGTSASGEMETTQQQQMTATPPPTGFDAEMEMMLQQLMMAIPSPPTEFAAGMETMQQEQQMMMAMPPAPSGFDAGMEMMQQHQQQMMTTMPQTTGFDAGTEMMQQQQMLAIPAPSTGFAAVTDTMQQQQMMMMSMPPPQTGFTAGMDTMQHNMMMAMPPPPTWFATGSQTMQQQTMMGFTTGLETQHQGFGHGFP